MTYKIQIAKGRKVEQEHLGTLRKMKAYQQRTGKYPSEKMFVESISKDHLRESSTYYTKLEKARL